LLRDLQLTIRGESPLPSEKKKNDGKKRGGEKVLASYGSFIQSQNSQKTTPGGRGGGPEKKPSEDSFHPKAQNTKTEEKGKIFGVLY